VRHFSEHVKGPANPLHAFARPAKTREELCRAEPKETQVRADLPRHRIADVKPGFVYSARRNDRFDNIGKHPRLGLDRHDKPPGFMPPQRGIRDPPKERPKPDKRPAAGDSVGMYGLDTFTQKLCTKGSLDPSNLHTFKGGDPYMLFGLGNASRYPQAPVDKVDPWTVLRDEGHININLKKLGSRQSDYKWTV
jgi:hypothetical protein